MKDTFIKFKQVIGGTEEEALEKFPWLKDAEFSDAVVDISNNYPIWKDGIWKDGVWKGGVWEYGTWEDGVWDYGIWKDGTWKGGVWDYGVWKDGTWKGGTWKGGVMWSNSKQLYENVEYKDGYFIVI